MYVMKNVIFKEKDYINMQTIYPILENTLVINQNLYQSISTARRINPIMQIIAKQNGLNLTREDHYTKAKQIFLNSIKNN